jgi:hypothetical protein
MSRRQEASMRRAFLLVVALVSVPRAAWAQGNPLGPEFRVNTYTTDAQYRPAVTSDAAGNFVVIWKSFQQEGSDCAVSAAECRGLAGGVFGQRYSQIVPIELMHFRVE